MSCQQYISVYIHAPYKPPTRLRKEAEIIYSLPLFATFKSKALFTCDNVNNEHYMNAKTGSQPLVHLNFFTSSNWDFWCKGPHELILFLRGVNCNKIR